VQILSIARDQAIDSARHVAYTSMFEVDQTW